MAHGFCSDRHSRGRFDRLSDDFVELGLAVCAFDFGGCGESDDDVVTAANEVEDLRAVLGFVRGAGFRRIALHGHSLGAAVCLEAYDEGVETLVLTGAATGPVHYDWTQYYSAEQLTELAETGRMRDGRHVLSKQTLREFAERGDLLAEIKSPVLLIHGDNDPEEQQLLTLSRKATLPDGSRLAVIHGATHSFEGYMDQVSALACDWYREHLR
jgi:pimeloyl-ACP methyl ester carboxylesterase